MAKVSKIGRSFWAAAVLAVIVGLCTGCADGLHKVMECQPLYRHFASPDELGKWERCGD